MGSGRPGWWSPPERDPVPDREPGKPTPTEDRLRRDYANLRLDCADLEELLGSEPSDLTAKDRKRLDKAVTVMKVAFKIVAKVLRRHGFDTSRHRDSGSGSQSEDPSGAEAEGPQSGGEAASPKS